MKKLYILFMGSFLFLNGVAFAGYTEPTYLEANKLNNTAYNQKESYREIQLVRFASRDVNAVSVQSGDAVVWDTVSDDGVTIRTTATSADGAFAGIACTTIQSPDGASNGFSDDAGRRNWGYIVRSGQATANASAGGTNGNAVGDILITSTDAGKVTTMAAIDTGGVGGPGAALRGVRGNGGFFYNAADGTSTTVTVYVKTK